MIKIINLKKEFKKPIREEGVGPLLQVVYNFLEYTRYPIKIYPYFIQFILTFIFPFALVISMPIETMLFNSYSTYVLCLMIIGVSFVFLFLAIVIWNLNARRYEST